MWGVTEGIVTQLNLIFAPALPRVRPDAVEGPRTIGRMATIEVAAPAYAALTEGCALVDRSARGKLAFTGEDATTCLDGQVTNAVVALQPGTGCYPALLSKKGKMLGDPALLRTHDAVLLDCERAALQGVFDVLRRALVGWDAELHKRTLQTAQVSLLGPRARAVAGAQDLPEAEHAHRESTVGGAAVRLVVTDAGVDVLCDAAHVEVVRAALVAAGAVAVDEEAAEVVRVESGRPRYAVDLDDTVI